MSYILACVVAFLGGFIVNMTYITVFYHRGFAHRAVRLRPWARRWVAATGNWVTGIDPKAWVCMHRLHHLHSDGPLDPHSPLNVGVFGVLTEQLKSYEMVARALLRGQEPHTALVRDLEFPVHWLARRRLWWLPYALHGAVALAFAAGTGYWLMGLAYWLGMMSHPVQGWLVNAFAHSSGSRSFATPDNSRNNTWVALVTMGEGYQNNHHQYPRAAKFSRQWWQIDMGYGLCLLTEALGVISIKRLASPPAAPEALPAVAARPG